MNAFIEVPIIRSPIARNKLVYGVGNNDSSYAVKQTVNGKTKICPFYRKWTNMLERCYSARYHKKNPTYKDCTVCDEWLSFELFRSWMILQKWQGMHLDKDIINYRNKIYSPKNCCFIPKELNLLLTNCRESKKELPLGVQVSTCGCKFIAQMSCKGKTLCLGTFNTIKEASKAYINKKTKIILELSMWQEDCRVRDGLRLYAKMLQCGLMH